MGGQTGEAQALFRESAEVTGHSAWQRRAAFIPECALDYVAGALAMTRRPAGARA